MSLAPTPEDKESKEDFIDRCLKCLELERIPERHKFIICLSKYINFENKI